MLLQRRQRGVTALLHRAGGVITPRRVGSASWVRGTSTLPSRAWGTVRSQKFDKLRTVDKGQNMYRPFWHEPPHGASG